MRKKRTLLIVLFCWVQAAQAWNSTGHKVIATIAYAKLSVPAKKEVNRLIHLLDSYYPKANSFVKASTWADSLRYADMTAFNTWHYINMPLIRGKSIKLASWQKQNVVWAIDQAAQVLRSNKTNDLEKALFLRFYIHLVGDIHQPLHCVSLYSDQFPKGDVGGHLYKVRSPYGDSLHAAWDEGLGVLTRWSEVNYIARDIQKKYPKKALSSRLKQKSPKFWAKEGSRLADQFVYTIRPGDTLTTTYLASGRDIVEQQLAIAGYRLADGLNVAFR